MKESCHHDMHACAAAGVPGHWLGGLQDWTVPPVVPAKIQLIDDLHGP
jgi:hypothetical protein